MRAASLAIGVNDEHYTTRWTETQSIAFAERDAEAMHSFLLSAWEGSDPSHHRRLTGLAATRAGIGDAVAQFGSGRYDHFTLFVAGHGVLSQGRAFFCLADGTFENPGLDASLLNEILLAIPADQILVFIDACHAEDVLFGCTFFTALRGATARHFMCGCRGVQRSWEHEPLGHGIFTWVLLEALGAGGDAAPELSDPDQVFAYVSEQVALRAMSLKGQQQEPVRGGVTRARPLLPRPPHARQTHSLSVLQVVSRRLRAAIVGGAVIACLAAMLTQLVASHVTTGASGAIVVRRGLPALGLPGNAGLLVETEFGYDSLSPVQKDLAALRANSIRQGQSQLTRSGYKTWARDVLPLLASRERARFELALDGAVPAELLQGTAEGAEPWLVELTAESLLFAERPDEKTLAWLDAAMPKLDESSDTTTLVDQSILGWDSSEFLHYIRASRALCVGRPQDAYAQFWRIHSVVAYRAGRAAEDRRDPAPELDAFADSFRALTAARADAGLDPLPKIELERLLSQRNEHNAAGLLAHCSLASVPSLLNDTVGPRIVDALLRYLEAFDLAAQGVPDWAQQAAMQYLTVVAVRYPLGDRLTALERRLSGGNGFESGPDSVRDFFRRIAERHALPSSILDRARTKVAAASPESMEADVLREVLAAQVRFLDPMTKVAVRDRFASILSADSQPNFATAPILAALSSSEQLPAELVTRIAGQVQWEWDPRLDVPVATVAQVVTHNDEPFVRALAAIARNQAVPEAARETLRRTAARRRSLPYYSELLDALRHQEDIRSTAAPTARAIHARLAADARNADQRRLNADVLASQLAREPRAARYREVDDLRSLWRGEAEPEIRLALFSVITQASVLPLP